MMNEKARSWVVRIVLLTMPMLGMGIDMIVPSLPAIAKEFASPTTAVKLSVGLFLLGYACMQIIAGFIADRYGRRPLFLIGSSLFVCSSFIASQAHSLELLLAMRIIQGFALAAPGVSARAMLIDSATKHDRARYGNYMAMAWSMGVIFSPVLGGFLQSYWSWRASFYWMMLYASIVTLLMAYHVPETKAAEDKVTLHQSMLRFRSMLFTPVFLLIITVLSLSHAVMMMFHVVGPFLIQNVWHYSVTTYSMVSLGLGVAWLIGSVINRMMISQGVRESLILQSSCSIFLFFASFLLWDGFSGLLY